MGNSAKFLLSLLSVFGTTYTKSYTNPILPGFHPDPSCIFVKELDNTFFCATSSFTLFPGVPIHASKDLVHWKLISSAFNNPEQYAAFGTATDSQYGIFAPTIRYNNGTFYLITTCVLPGYITQTLIFETSDPYNEKAWSNPIQSSFQGIDPSLLWDDRNNSYVTGSNLDFVSGNQFIELASINPVDGISGTISTPYNGTGAISPEGPHLYQKDGYYYLMIAQGGTGLDHQEVIARSKNVLGPFSSYEGNPILTNANTTEYFQTVGHADLFQDGNGSWWGVALSTRSGPEYTTYPMGRETVLLPVSWPIGQWPTLTPVQGRMDGPLPPETFGVPGSGAFINTPDIVDFKPGSTLPSHFVHLRFPENDAYTVSPPNHPGTLQLTPSLLNLTGSSLFNITLGQTFLARRQVDTLFTYTVDISYSPKVPEEEAGVSLYLTQDQHIDLGIVMLPSSQSSKLAPHLRLSYHSTSDVPPTIVTPLTNQTYSDKIRLQIQAVNSTHFAFSAGPSTNEGAMNILGTATGSLVSGGFTGAIVGVYATSNGGPGNTKAYISRWRYTGQGQYIGI